MQILQTHRFQKQIKKLHPQMKSIVDEAVKAVLDNPLVGEAKIGDLQGIYVYKFRMNNMLMLLAYTFTQCDLTLMSFGSHENFYRDLKKASF